MIKRWLDPNRSEGRFFYCLLAIAIAVGMAHATGPALTSINDVVYRADGQPATGALVISWTAFTTADNKPVAAGELSLILGSGGSINTALAPNEGATPTGSYYKVVYKLSDGTTATEYWVVPVASPATVAKIRARVVPTQVAAQLVSRQYVDSALSGSDTLVVHKDGSESITGVKAFAVSPTAPNPTSNLAIANKTYVDTTVTAAIGAVTTGFVNKSGDTMGGPLVLAADPVTPGQAADRHYVDLQAALATAAIAQLSFQNLPGRQETFGFLVNAVVDCGLIGNGTTNDGPALQACITANPGKHIVLPKMQAVGGCDYNMGSTNIQPKGHGQIIEGIGAGFGQVGSSTPNTTLCWNTEGVSGVTFINSQCQNCTLKNISVQGPDYFAGAQQLIPPCNPPASQVYNAGVVCVSGGDGVQVQANFTNLENLYVSSWGRHGVNLDATCSGCSQFSDNFHAINVTTNNNRGDGWYTHGGDSNAGSALQLHAYSNQMFGIDETGFLGNTYYSPEAHTNNPSPAAGPTFASTASRTANAVTLSAPGHNFSVGNVLVVAGMSDASFNGTFSISATTSSTATYAQTGTNSTATGGTSRLASGAEYFAFTGIVGGGYNVPPSGAAWNTFYSPYCEGDQPPAKFGSHSLIIGGDIGCDINYAVNAPFVIGHSLNGSSITGPVMTYPTFYNRVENDGVAGWAAGAGTANWPIHHRFYNNNTNTIFWEWVMSPNSNLASTDASMTLWRLGNGQKQRFTLNGPASGGNTLINDEGTSTRINNSSFSSGEVEFYNGGFGGPTRTFYFQRTGSLQQNAYSNNIDIIQLVRATDTAPTGNFLNFKNAAGSSVFAVDVAGFWNVGSMDVGRITSGTLGTLRGGTGVADLTFSGSTHKVATASGTLTSGDCVKIDASGNVADNGAPCAGGGVPSGSGFTHITSGSQDAAAKAVDVSSADITGIISKSHQAATTMYTDQANVVTSGKLGTVASTASGAGLNIPAGVAPTSPVVGDHWMVGTNIFYRDNGGTPATQTVEIQSNKNAANGYAGVDGTSKVLAANLPSVSALSGSLAATQMPALSGDITSAAGAVATTLAASGVTAGSCVRPTVDAKGRATSCASTVSLTTDASGTLQASQFPALTGDVTTVSGALAATLAASGVASGTYNQVTVDSKGRVTAGNNPGVSNTTAVTVAGAVSTDQNLISITLPAGSLNIAGKIWKSYAGGIYSTTTTGAGAMTFKAKLCTVSGCGSGTVVTLATFGPTAAQSASATNMPWNIELPIVTGATGTTGTVFPEGNLSVVLGTTATAAGAIHVAQSTAASATIDLTAQVFIQFTIADSGASANNSFKQLVGYSIPLN